MSVASLRRAALLVSVVASLVAPSPNARAATSAVVAPGAAGQRPMAVEIRPAAGGSPGGILVRACAPGETCSAAGGTMLTAAELDNLLPLMQPRVVRIEGGRHVVLVEANAEGARYVVILAAPLVGDDARPKVIWRGWTGGERGVHGEKIETTLTQVDTQKGAELTLRSRREDASVCGRPTISNARAVDGSSLSLRRLPLDETLTAAERAGAERLVAQRAPDGPAPFRILRAVASGASSGYGRLTDGDPSSAWSEDVPGDGQFEFVTLAAPRRVGITAIDIVVRPTRPASEGGDPSTATLPSAGPRQLYLALPDRAFSVSFPEDGAAHPGQAYRVTFSEPLRTECVSVVLGESYGDGVEVTTSIAEVSARTALDGKGPDELAAELGRSGDRAEAAADILARGGREEVEAAMRGYLALGPSGRDLARRAIDRASCELKAPFFAGIYTKTKDADEYSRAIDRMARCREESAAALRVAIASDEDREIIRAADALSLLAPPAAVPVLLDRMAEVSDPVRKQLRSALAHAVGKPKSRAAVIEALEPARFEARSLVVRIDLLRALGPKVAELSEARAAWDAVMQTDASFRTRYLMLAPTAELAKGGDREAVRILDEAIRADASPHVRSRAARVASGADGLVPAVLSAARDEGVRVRESALRSLSEAAARGKPLPGKAEATAVERLSKDVWTFNRIAAVDLLTVLPTHPRIDAAIARAMEDSSPHVRAEAILALGVRGARGYAEAIRERMEDRSEPGVVRASAIQSLAAMCDGESLDDWTRYAAQAALPLRDDDRRLGMAAVAALGAVHPEDLKERLAPLLDRRVAPDLRAAVKLALQSKGECR